jgi:transposase-like protein
MLSTVTIQFEGSEYPSCVILQAVWWYLRSPLAYGPGLELLAEKGTEHEVPAPL